MADKPVLVNLEPHRLIWSDWHRSEGETPRMASMPVIKARNAFDHDTGDVDPGLDCQFYVDEDGEVYETPSLTRQSDADDCDINVMMARYQTTGVAPRSNPREPQWGDFSSVASYQDALNTVLQAQTDFDLLDAHVRERFGNNPSKMLEFLADEKNYDEAVKLGLVVPKEVPEPQAVRVVNPPEDIPPKPSKGKSEAGD